MPTGEVPFPVGTEVTTPTGEGVVVDWRRRLIEPEPVPRYLFAFLVMQVDEGSGAHMRAWWPESHVEQITREEV